MNKYLTKIFLPVFVILFLSYGFYTPGLSSSNKQRNFLFGIMNDETFDNPSFKNTIAIGVNTSHTYNTGANLLFNSVAYPRGRSSSDGVNDSLLSYIESVRKMLDEMNRADSKRRFLLSRPKIDWMCRGQSSIYQCENITSGDTWFYSFNDHIGVDSPDGNARFCKAGYDNAGYIVKRLKANTEQCNESDEGNPWLGDSQCQWYVKPKIKIPASFINGHENDTVCIVKVIKQDGTTSVLITAILAGNFLENGRYDGDYKEMFNFAGENKLKFYGDLGNNWVNSARGTSDNDDKAENKADIQVYWTGKCDMWIDYIKVENETANNLLDENEKNPEHIKYLNWLKEEEQQIGQYRPEGALYPTVMKFYIELTEFNNLPCIKYVNDKLREFAAGNDTIDVMADYTVTNLVHVNKSEEKKITNPDWIYRNYILRGGFSQFFTEVYPFRSEYGTNFPAGHEYFSKIPSSLQSKSRFILAKPIPPEEYDTWLQDNLDRSPFQLEAGGSSGGNKEMKYDDCTGNKMWQVPGEHRYVMKIGNEMLRKYNVPFILMSQAHMWYRKGEVRREPLNEEIEMLSNLAISYGVTGLMYFQFNSDGKLQDKCSDNSSSLQISPELPGFPAMLEKNIYNQDTAKWKVLRAIGNRIKKWEQYLINSEYNSVRSFYCGNKDDYNSLLKTYFNQIITFKAGASDCFDEDSPSGTKIECPEERYIQTGMFTGTDANKTKFFMIVNRRCSPIVNGFEDGRRYVRIKFDANAPELSGSTRWKIIDLESGTTAAAFVKNILGNIDLGWFYPGQGKLYKIVPEG